MKAYECGEAVTVTSNNDSSEHVFLFKMHYKNCNFLADESMNNGVV